MRAALGCPAAVTRGIAGRVGACGTMGRVTGL